MRNLPNKKIYVISHIYYSINMKFDANSLIKSAIANPKGNTGKAKEKLTFIDEYLINE